MAASPALGDNRIIGNKGEHRYSMFSDESENNWSSGDMRIIGCNECDWHWESIQSSGCKRIIGRWQLHRHWEIIESSGREGNIGTVCLVTRMTKQCFSTRATLKGVQFRNSRHFWTWLL